MSSLADAIFDRLLPKRFATGVPVSAFAPSNIALSKYWGKRDVALNLPTNSSLSISLGNYGTHTHITAAHADSLTFNGQTIACESALFQRTFAFVERFRRGQDLPLAITTENTIPTAAGLASSASGFAALSQVLCAHWQWDLPLSTLSVLTRMGSGSACRSLWHGFVHWQAGQAADGLDSFATPIATDWHDLRLAVVVISTAPKALSSTHGMNHTVASSPLYAPWASTAEHDVQTLLHAIATRNFTLLGQTAEANALAMHATMLAARPAVCYFAPQSLAVLQQVWQLREQGVEVYATMDAGANVKILYPVEAESLVQSALPAALSGLDIWWINPFATIV